MNKIGEGENKKRGELKQHKQDKNKEKVAIFFAPKQEDSIPLKTQAIAPEAIIKKDSKATLR